MIITNSFLRVTNAIGTNNPPTINMVLFQCGLTLQKSMMDKYTLQNNIIPTLTASTDTDLAVATAIYAIESIACVTRDVTGQYYPVLDEQTTKQFCEVLLQKFPIENISVVIRNVIDEIDAVSKIVEDSNIKNLQFKETAMDMLTFMRDYFYENLETSVGYSIAKSGDDDSAICIGNSCIQSFVKDIHINPSEDLRQLVFMDVFNGDSIDLVDSIGSAAGKAIVALKPDSGVIEGAMIVNSDMFEQVMTYLVEVRCAASNTKATKELCEKTNYDLECDLYKNTTTSEDCIANVNPSRFGWNDTDIIIKGTVDDNGIPINPDNKTDKILSQPQITGHNIQYVLGAISLEKDKSKRDVITEKLKDSVIETLIWEIGQESYSDLPIVTFLDRTCKIMECMTQNTEYNKRLHEAVDVLETSLFGKTINGVEECGGAVPATFNPCPTLNSITPAPVEARVSQQLFNKIWKAETEDEMDDAMMEFAKSYYVEEGLFKKGSKSPVSNSDKQDATKKVKQLLEKYIKPYNSDKDAQQRILMKIRSDYLYVSSRPVLNNKRSMDNYSKAEDLYKYTTQPPKMTIKQLPDDDGRAVFSVGDFPVEVLKMLPINKIVKDTKNDKTFKDIDCVSSITVDSHTHHVLVKFKDVVSISETTDVAMETNAASKKAREVSRKVQQGSEKAIRGTGGTIHEIKQAAHNAVDPMERYIGQMMEKIKKADRDERRNIIIKGGIAPKVLRWVKRSIPLIAGAAVGTVVTPAAVASGIALIGFIASDKALDAKEKRKILREIEDEIEIVNEKIDDSRGDSNKQKKYELIRIRNDLKRTQDRIVLNLKE